ncbi:MAG: alpha/beta fold hydrolase [Anaerolineales bacterium]|nr:alpha/beta fold hydrolase [Anaerolineales bacterium]
MTIRKHIPLLALLSLFFITGCRQASVSNPTGAAILPTNSPTSNSQSPTAKPSSTTPALTPTPLSPSTSPTPTSTLTPTPTAAGFEVGQELTIAYLRALEITGSTITFEEKLADRSNYHQHLVSYLSEGNQIYGLLTIPFGEPPQGGFKAVVFNHGYIPPAAYRTTERYTAYVDYLARSGFVVFKIDLRGHGNSQGEPSGSYFSPGYTIDAIAALKSLQTLDYVDPQGIGLWGHSMAGNLVLRAMLIEPDIKAGVIWAGAVYSYDDLMTYGIDDNTYQPPPTATPGTAQTPEPPSGRQLIFETYGRPDTQVEYWQAVALTENIEYLNRPLQLHHASDDTVVNIAYSYGLAEVLQQNGKLYEFYEYEGGGHNLVSPYFEQAMQRTVEFLRQNL